MRESLYSVISRMPGRFHKDRGELLDLLLRQGILHRSPIQPVLSRDGSSARWILDSLSFTLQRRGAELAGRCLAALLERFDGKQLATYGLTGVPLLQSIILQSDGRYHGLLVRKELKQHGSLRRIEGCLDLDEPTIIIDDSISSGLCMDQACSFLEDAGVRVEGGIALVRFGWDTGYAFMQERGYHMEAVYDVWDDIMTRMPDELRISHNPSKRRTFAELPCGGERLAGGLHPAQVARRTMEQYLRAGTVPHPPEQLDATYDSAGGVWISVRDAKEIYLRHARNGFWHFPDEIRGTTTEDIVTASVQTADELKGEFASVADALATLEQSYIAVTFFGPLQECTVGELDNDRYGIVVSSRERPGQMGGALPNMPGILNEWEQYRHAWRNNAQLRPYEPCTVFRHDLTKVVEPGVRWQPSGVPNPTGAHWHDDPQICGRIAERVRDIAASKLLGRREALDPVRDNILAGGGIAALFTTIYVGGTLRGCAGAEMRSLSASLDEAICTFIDASIADERFDTGIVPTEDDEIAVTVSFLFNALVLGEMSPEEVRPRFQLGRQALSVSQNRRTGMLLPFVAVTQDLDRAEFVAEVIDKAGITRGPYQWLRHDCATWLSDKWGTVQTEFNFRPRDRSEPFEESIRLLAGWQSEYLLRMQREDGSLWFTYLPFHNSLYSGDGAPRSAHAAWTLVRAQRQLGGERLRKGSTTLLEFHLSTLRGSDDGVWLEGDGEPSVSELSFLLLALIEIPPASPEQRSVAERIASMLWSRIDRHGRVQTHRNLPAGTDEYQDYFPQQTLLALAAAAAAGIAAPEDNKLERAFRYYRHRYRYRRNHAHASWLMQAAARWYACTRHEPWAELVFEIGDWICSYQLKKNGGFISDYQEDGPGYTTALFLEGLSAALDTAATRGDQARYIAYTEACKRGISFMTDIIVRPDDDTILPNGAFAVGGVRASLTSSRIRTDFVQHSLAAVLELYSHLGIGVSEQVNGRYLTSTSNSR